MAADISDSISLKEQVRIGELVLAASAEYIADGDTILAEIYLQERLGKVFYPQYVKEGIAKILFGGTAMYTLKFDRRFGTEDGSFKLLVLHPRIARNLYLQLNVVLTDGTPMNCTVPVTLAQAGGYIPLAAEAVTIDATPDLRARLRTEENL